VGAGFAAFPAPVFGLDGEKSGEWVEGPLLDNEGAIRGTPPVAAEEPRGDAVSARAVPDKDRARLQNPRKLPDHLLIVLRLGEEAKRREEVDHRVETAGPSLGKRAHVRARVPQLLALAAASGAGQQLTRIVHAIDVVAGFREQVRVSPLAARAIENARADGKFQDLDQAADVTPIALEIEEGLVFDQIPVIEVRGPPIRERREERGG
jgi:hypothetical protein